MKYIKEFQTSKMCHKCAWDPKTEKMNEALFEIQNAFFHGQLEQFQYDEVKKDFIDHSKTKAPNLKCFKMVNIYDSIASRQSIKALLLKTLSTTHPHLSLND